MAGKTFHGVGGDFDGESPPLDPNGAAPTVELQDDGREPYSGPTVVDDAKIAESLKRLRSLDQPPPDTLIGVTAVVLDPPSSEPTRIDDRPLAAALTPTPLVVTTSPPPPTATPTPVVTALPAGHPMATTVPGAPPISRPTAVGHNSVGNTTVLGQQNVYQLDPLRGTMFGHSIHLPDVNAPETATEDLSSGQLLVVPRPTAEEMRPFLPGTPGAADRSTRQAQQRPKIELEAAIPLPPQIEPMRRTELFHEPESETDIVSGARSRVRGRTAFVVVLLAAAAGVAFAWIYSHNEPSPGMTPVAPLAAPPPASPGLGTSSTATPPAPAPTPAVAPPTAPVPEAKAQPDPGSRPAGDVEPARGTAQSDDKGTRHTRRDRRHPAEDAPAASPPPAAEANVAAPKPTEAKAEPTEAKPEKAAETRPAKAGKGKKHGETDEDPDGTMGPSE